MTFFAGRPAIIAAVFALSLGVLTGCSKSEPAAAPPASTSPASPATTPSVAAVPASTVPQGTKQNTTGLTPEQQKEQKLFNAENEKDPGVR